MKTLLQNNKTIKINKWLLFKKTKIIIYRTSQNIPGDSKVDKGNPGANVWRELNRGIPSRQEDDKRW